VAQKPPEILRLHVDEATESDAAPLDSASLTAILRAFADATGWRLSYASFPGDSGFWSAPVSNGEGTAGGRLILEPLPAAANRQRRASSPIDLEQARPLALAIAGMLGEINRLKRAVCEREAELAAGVPVAARPDEQEHLALRLTSVLKAGAESVGADAAGLYLLDDATSSLKLRAAFGLPQDRLLDPPRPLRGAVADLEALVGHAVVLEDTSLLPHWRCPEPFAAALCVPVASPTMPLGTLWVFSRQCRDFDEDQTNLIEIVAGRIAADLDREMLLAESTQARRRNRLFEAAFRWQQDRLPSVMPLVDNWEFAGWTQHFDALGGDFYDWCVLPDARVALAVASAHGRFLEAGLNAAALQAALKSHAAYAHDAAQLLSRVSETLWTVSSGDQFASLAYGLVSPADGRVELALAGTVAAMIVRRERRELISGRLPPLGAGPDAKHEVVHQELQPGDVLVLLTEGARNATDEAGLCIGEAAIATAIRKARGQPAREVATQLRKLLERGQGGEDMTVLVARRRE
jgi:serine phosphatase RsbU (regulator of sigma subunit)